MTAEMFNVLDLFSGAGGLTEGFCQQGNYRMISHVEMNPWAAETLETRMLYHRLRETGNTEIYNSYMHNLGNPGARREFLDNCAAAGISATGVLNRELSDQSRGEIAGEVDKELKKNGKGQKIDIIIGGPPCQAYSTMNRFNLEEDLSDPRLYLYMQYMYCLKTFRPRMFVFENVPGMISIRSGMFRTNIEESMKEAGYHVKMQILDAADFGVIQHRKRIIFIGWRNDEDILLPDFGKSSLTGTVHDLFMEDLPILNNGEGEVVQKYRAGPTEYLKKSGIRTEEQDVLLQHVVRPTCDRDLEIYRLAIRAMNEGKRIKYTDLPEHLRTHRNETAFLDRFKVVNENGLSHSMVAHISKDGHYFIHPDIEHPRSLSVREAARIQSFPDDFIFEGPRTAQFVQIGNAVPPLMAKGIAKAVAGCLRQ